MSETTPNSPLPAPHPLTNQEILFTRQRHEADRMGLHWDYRMVLGDKAYSWATKKEMPEPGKAILLFEQPVHDREYALSEKVVIPKGNYGAGVTHLEYVRKAKVEDGTEADKLVITTKDGGRFLLKKLDEVKYGKGKPWLFKNLAKYSEGPESTFTHDGKDFKVDDAILLGGKNKTVQIPVSELDWALEDAHVDPSRVEIAQTHRPVLVTDWQGKKVVIDGTHRLFKAKSEGREFVPTKYVDTTKLNEVKSNRYLEKISSNVRVGELEKGAAVFSISQALDNKGEDLYYHHTDRKNVTDSNHRSMMNYDMSTAVKRKGHEYSSGNVKLKRTSNRYLLQINTNARDVAGRQAPLVVHLEHHNMPDLHKHVQDAVHAANQYHSQFKNVVSDFSTSNLNEELDRVVKGVHKVHRNSILKKVGLGVAGAGVVGLGIHSYLKNRSESKKEGV